MVFICMNATGHVEDSELKSLKKQKEKHTNRGESFTIVPPEDLSKELGPIFNRIEAAVGQYS